MASDISALETAHVASDAARQAILPFFRCQLDVENKSLTQVEGEQRFDPVTQADRDAEHAIRNCIVERFPEDAIVGEELPDVLGTSAYTWVIDPIDGTRAFVTGSPLWGTLIARLDEARPALGVLDQPFTEERFFADRTGAYIARGTGRAARVGQPIKTRHCTELSRATISTTHPDLFASAGDALAFREVAAQSLAVRYGGDCYAYGLLAVGGLDLVIESGLKPYDIAALVPIVQGAGGVITGWNGQSAAAGGRVVAAGCPAIHEAALKVLAQADDEAL